MATTKVQRRTRLRRGIRNRISGTADRPRLSVFKSNKGIYAQLIDDVQGHTLVAVSSSEVDKKASANIELSKKVGSEIAKKAKASGIEAVVFDRGGYLYHGNIKALADGAREGGLKF
jgi:large subunit ribosomal protein L18